MVGPSRKVNGGMTTVVNNYFKSDLKNKIDLKYISTTIDVNILIKLLYNFISYIKIIICLIISKVDIVHIHMASRGSFYRKSIIVKLSKLFNKKVIIHLHGAEFEAFYESESNDKAKKYIRSIFEQADKVIVLSSKWREILDKWFQCNIEILNNAIFLNPENIYNTNSNNIVMLGRLEERKGTYDLLNVVKPITNQFNNIKFLLAGDGDLQKLKLKIKSLGIEEDVNVLGWINEKERDEILRNSLIYVLPSYNEGMPMSVLEAMSYGVPTISTTVGGIPDIIDSNVNGYLINPGNVKDLEEKIKLLINNKDLREKISINGYIKIRDKFNMEKQVQKLLIMYKELQSI